MIEIQQPNKTSKVIAGKIEILFYKKNCRNIGMIPGNTNSPFHHFDG